MIVSQDYSCKKSKCELHTILPYLATTNVILTTMINFQDALKQKGDTHGGLWADEGVYCITKEIQLMIPEFTNILFGLDGFHTEKIAGLSWFIPRNFWNFLSSS